MVFAGQKELIDENLELRIWNFESRIPSLEF